MTDENPEIKRPTPWTESVETFLTAATWLTGADAPQVQALRSIATALDSGTFQSALISQFTLVHRGLMSRDPASRPGKAASDDDALFEEKYGSEPLAMWRADR